MRLCGPDAAAAFSLLRTFSTLAVAKDGDGQRFFVQTMRTGRYLRCVREKKNERGERGPKRGLRTPSDDFSGVSDRQTSGTLMVWCRFVGSSEILHKFSGNLFKADYFESIFPDISFFGNHIL